MDAFRRVYGAHPLHLLTLVVGFALLGYVLATIGPSALWNNRTWWQSIAVWFAASIIAHDLVLYPLYTLADRILLASQLIPRAARARVPVVNYLRVPALASGLLLVVFLPGIIKQGAPTYLAATGQTQDPFLGRWLLLTAVLFAASAVVYALRLAVSRTAVKPPPG